MRACTKNDRDRNEKRRIRLKNVMKIREKNRNTEKRYKNRQERIPVSS
jgi:hypothetical protein